MQPTLPLGVAVVLLLIPVVAAAAAAWKLEARLCWVIGSLAAGFLQAALVIVVRLLDPTSGGRPTVGLAILFLAMGVALGGAAALTAYVTTLLARYPLWPIVGFILGLQRGFLPAIGLLIVGVAVVLPAGALTEAEEKQRPCAQMIFATLGAVIAWVYVLAVWPAVARRFGAA
jgi:hypothetical protein